MQPLSLQKTATHHLFSLRIRLTCRIMLEKSILGFNVLKDRLATIVDDSEHDLFFHHDESHICSFDESKLQHGVIYDLRKGKR